MKSLLIFLGLLVAVYAGCEIPPEMKQDAEDCAKEVGLADVSRLNQADLVEQPEKAAVVCMLKKRSMMIDGKLHLDNVMENIMKVYPNLEDIVRPRIVECVELANVQFGEEPVAQVMHKCFMEKICSSA